MGREEEEEEEEEVEEEEEWLLVCSANYRDKRMSFKMYYIRNRHI